MYKFWLDDGLKTSEKIQSWCKLGMPGCWNDERVVLKITKMYKVLLRHGIQFIIFNYSKGHNFLHNNLISVIRDPIQLCLSMSSCLYVGRY